MYCGRLSLFICLSNIHVKWPFIAFKRWADVVSLRRLDRLWFFRHHWFVKIGWLGKNGVQDTNLLDQIISVSGCLKSVQNSYFRSRPAIFWFSGALPQTLWHNIPPSHIILTLSWPILALLLLCWAPSEKAACTSCEIFGMTRPGIEPATPGHKAGTLPLSHCASI